jgi:hypothetical protein
MEHRFGLHHQKYFSLQSFTRMGIYVAVAAPAAP